MAIESLEERQLLAVTAGLMPTSADPLVVTTLQDVVSSTDNVVSLREALAQAQSGDVITFDVSGTIKLNSVLQVNGGVTIDGGNCVTVSGNNKTTVFEITGSNTVFKNLTVVEGYNNNAINDGRGGAITYLTWASDGMITIDNCIFLGNHVSNGGGAIYIFNAGANITNSTFGKGDYSSVSAWSGSGLSLETYAHEVVIDHCEFSEMNESYAGGAFYINGSANITISNSNFHDNANWRGSSLHISGNSYVNVISTEFTNNAAGKGLAGEDGQYGTLYVTGSTLTLTDCTLSGNSGNNLGGTLFSDNSTVYIFGGSFSENSLAANDEFGGAAIALWENSMLYVNTEVTVNEDDGSLIYTYVDSATEFTDNTANASNNALGGAIYCHKSNAVIANASFIGNAAVPISGSCSRGGAVHLNLGNMSFVNTLFAENKSKDTGGAFNMFNTDFGCSASFDYCTFSGNLADNGSATHYGDAIFSQQAIAVNNSIIAENSENDITLHTGMGSINTDNSVLGTIAFLDSDEAGSTFGLNTLYYSPEMPLFEVGGYALTADSVAVDLSNSNRYGINDLAGNPGCDGVVSDAGCYEFQSVPADPLVVTTLEDIVDSTDGLISLREALVAATSGDTVTFAVEGTIELQSVLQVNEGIAIDGGGKITLDGCDATTIFEVLGSNTTFLNLTMVEGFNDNGPNSGCGGAITYLTWASDGKITIDHCDFIGNHASSGGGAVYIFNADASITNSTFSLGDYSSVYAWSGSGLFLATYAHEVVVDHCEFSDLKDSYFGGGIYVNDSATNVTVSNSSFHDNGNYRGSSIYLTGGANVTVISSTFENNASTQGQGGDAGQFGTIYVLNSTVTLTDCDFTGNAGTLMGGALFLSGSTANIFGGSFIGNTVTANNEWGGAAIGLWDGSHLFVNTNADGSYADAKTLFDGNIASAADSTYGGAIYCFQSTAVIANASFTDNSAIATEGTTTRGGAIHVGTGTMTIVNSLFAGNSAADSGGAFNIFHNDYATVSANFDYCTFAENSAPNGGAIFTQTDVTVTNSIAAENGENDIFLHTGVSSFNAANSVVGAFAYADAGEDNVTLADSVVYSTGMTLFEEGSYTLADGSVAVNLSDGTRLGLTDLAGNPGCVGKISDAGCYENQNDSPTVALDTPIIATGNPGFYVSYGANRHQIQWGAVANASGYEVQHAAAGAEWTTVQASDVSTVITGLAYGADVTYRVRALGTGSYTDSDWSAAKTFNVCPMDINNDGDISGSDRNLLASSWLAEEGDDEYQYYADINGDGDISGADRNFVSNNWLGEAGDDDLTYPRALPAADAVFAAYEAGDLDVDFDVF